MQETFRAIAAAAGGEEQRMTVDNKRQHGWGSDSCTLRLPQPKEQGLKAMERNLALMVFLPKQIAASAEAG